MSLAADIDPMEEICPLDLLGKCQDRNCKYHHLKKVKPLRLRALDTIDELKNYLSDSEWRAAEKSVVRAKLEVHEGKKNIEEVVTSLIATVCPNPSRMPYYRRTKSVDQKNVE